MSQPPDWKPPAGFVDYSGDGNNAAPPPLEHTSERSSKRSSLSPASRLEAAAAALEAQLEIPRGVCPGCGAHFQSDDEHAPGFTPPHVLSEMQAKVDEDGESVSHRMVVCQRCHGLRHQNRLPVETLRVSAGDDAHESLRPEHFLGMLRGISRERCVVVAIVDLFDFHGSLVPDLSVVVGDNPLVLVGNKFDLLPAAAAAKDVERWVRAEARKAKVPSPQSVHLVSCRTGAGLPKLLDELHFAMGRRKLDAYVVGAANAGKSTFINHCLRQAGGKGGKGGKGGGGGRGGGGGGGGGASERSLTTSHLPGTTLDFVRVSLGGSRGGPSLYDTPGVILPGQITTRLTTEELAQVVPKKRAQHVTLRVGAGKSVLLGGVARVHMLTGRPFLFTFYLANAVRLHPTDSAKVEAVLAKHAGGLLAPPASFERLAELGEFGRHEIHVPGRGWDEAALDVVLPGLGWVAVTGAGECTIAVELPQPTTPRTREPLIPSEKGKGARASMVKFTGSKLRDKRGNAKRRA